MFVSIFYASNFVAPGLRGGGLTSSKECSTLLRALSNPALTICLCRYYTHGLCVTLLVDMYRA